LIYRTAGQEQAMLDWPKTADSPYCLEKLFGWLAEPLRIFRSRPAR
jgi:hypothetical protein